MRRFIVMSLTATLLAAMPALAEEAAEERVGDPWPLNVCAKSGEELGSMGDPVVKVIDGRELRFCCAGCIKGVEKSPESYLPEMDKKIIESQADRYPLTTCLNSGGDLGADGGVSFVAGNRLMRTCCKNCQAKVEADPAAFMAKLDAAVIEAQKADYPAKVCVVGGHEIGDEPTDIVVGNQLVRLCCAGCQDAVYAEPVKFISMLEAAKNGEPLPKAEGSEKKKS